MVASHSWDEVVVVVVVVVGLPPQITLGILFSRASSLGKVGLRQDSKRDIMSNSLLSLTVFENKVSFRDERDTGWGQAFF